MHLTFARYSGPRPLCYFERHIVSIHHGPGFGCPKGRGWGGGGTIGDSTLLFAYPVTGSFHRLVGSKNTSNQIGSDSGLGGLGPSPKLVCATLCLHYHCICVSLSVFSTAQRKDRHTHTHTHIERERNILHGHFLSQTLLTTTILVGGGVFSDYQLQY